MDCDSASLLLAAKCFGEISTGDRPGVRDYLLCQWANKPTCDPDALAFLSFAGITDATISAAICQLVTSLKTNPAPPATSFWSRDHVIYPFAGQTVAVPNRVNLKAPGTNTLLQPGGAPNYTLNGVQGVIAASAYLNTQYTIPLGFRNSFRISWYLTAPDSSVAAIHFYFGTDDSITTSRTAARFQGGGVAFYYDVNDASTTVSGGAAAQPLGACLIQRRSPTQVERAYGAVPTLVATAAVNSVVPSDVPLYLFTLDNGGPPGAFYSDSTLGGFSLGEPFTTDAEVQLYKSIWDTYEAALGRAHPLAV